MKISYNWLRPYLCPRGAALLPAELEKILTGIGLEVESLETLQSIPGGLKNVVVGQVETCQPHPNADRLKVTTVNTGQGINTIVCGAPNVAQGQKVIVALPGAELYPIQGEPFTIKPSKIRGEESNGMLCAEDELGLGQSHDGILVLPADAVVGTPAAEWFKLETDYIFEIGLTPNRGDAASHFGVARDVNAWLGEPTTMPDCQFSASEPGHGSLAVNIHDADACPRYSALVLDNVKVGPSPEWLQNRLRSIGIKAINNVVDVTNYVLHTLGQPMHAYNAEVVNGVINVTYAGPGAVFTTLDGARHTLTGAELVVANATGPMCLAGIYGGKDSGVTDGVTTIVLESAYFNPVTIRQASKRLGLKTDSSFRFERGTDPEMVLPALCMAAQMLAEVAGARIVSNVVDAYPAPLEPFEILLKYANVTRLIGQELAPEKIQQMLKGLNITYSHAEGGLRLEVPRFKADVTRECDVIEEILRLHGLDNVPMPQQLRSSLPLLPRPDAEAILNTIAESLVAGGFYEIYSNSLTSRSAIANPEQAVKLENPLSTELDTMRDSMLPGLLQAMAYNINRKRPSLKFFELGRVYSVAGTGFTETPVLSMAVCGDETNESWSGDSRQASFLTIKHALDSLLTRVGAVNYTTGEGDVAQLAYSLTYSQGPMVLAQAGQAESQFAAAFGVNVPVYFAQVFVGTLLKVVTTKVKAADVQKYPSVRRDLSLLISSVTPFSQIKQAIIKGGRQMVQQVNVFDVYRGDKLPDGTKSYAVSIMLYSAEKTLTDKEINGVMEAITAQLGKIPGLEIRK